MNEDKFLVAFIDICGFQQMIDDQFSGKDTSIIPTLSNALNEAMKEVDISREAFKIIQDLEFNTKQFSDCISISLKFPLDGVLFIYLTTFLSVIRKYQRTLMSHGIFVRGGVSFGKHYETDQMIFSEALVDSYKIESKIARYPRIVINQKIISEILLDCDCLPQNITNYVNSLILMDWEKVCFVNPFEDKSHEILVPESDKLTKEQIQIRSDFLKTQKDTFNEIMIHVKQNLSKELKPDVMTKYLWLEQLMNWYMTPEKSNQIFVPLIQN